MDRLINIRLLSEPMNWLTISMMIMIAAVGFLVVYSHAISGGEPVALQKEV